MPINAEQNRLFWKLPQTWLSPGTPFLLKDWLPLLKFAMFPKTHFHPRGVAKMENQHFDPGFKGTQIRALAQRGAQNSCPVTISKVFDRCFLFARSEGGEFGPRWLCQATFACKIRVICEGPTIFTYKTRVIWS